MPLATNLPVALRPSHGTMWFSRAARGPKSFHQTKSPLVEKIDRRVWVLGAAKSKTRWVCRCWPRWKGLG